MLVNIKDMTPVVIVNKIENFPLKAYCFRFKEWDCVWANFYIDTDKGLFYINSDWGDFYHRWGLSGMAKTSKDFEHEIARFSPDYISNKFSYGRKDFKEFKSLETVNELKNQLLEKRRSDEINKPNARLVWQKLHSLRHEDDDRAFYEQLNEKIEYIDIDSHHDYEYDDMEGCGESPSVATFLNEDYESLSYGPTWKANFLKDDLLPVFLKYLRESLCK